MAEISANIETSDSISVSGRSAKTTANGMKFRLSQMRAKRRANLWYLSSLDGRSARCLAGSIPHQAIRGKCS